MKKKVILSVVILILGILLFGKGLLVQKISIDVLNEEGTDFSRKELSQEDSKTIRKIISPQIAIPDSGFVFAEGKYRIVLETLGAEIHMYPYCGDTYVFRVGDKGSWLIELDLLAEEQADTIAGIVNKYGIRTSGMYDWSKVK